MEHQHIQHCSNVEFMKIDHPTRKAQCKKQAACMQLTVEEVNKKADDFINNFRQPLKNTAYAQFVAADVNKNADDFIKNFRKQLKFERLESLKRYRETIDRQKKG